MNFKSFVIGAKKRLQFLEGHEYDEQNWQDKYVEFKEFLQEFGKDAKTDSDKLDTWAEHMHCFCSEETSIVWMRESFKKRVTSSS